MSFNIYYVILICSVMLASISQIFLKKSACEQHSSIIKEYLNVKVITGYSLLVVSTLLTIYAFTGMDYKNGPVIESTGYIFVMVLSLLFLKEKITHKKLIGNALILVGILVFYS